LSGTSLRSWRLSTQVRSASSAAIQRSIEDPVEPLDLDAMLRLRSLAVARDFEQVRRNLPTAVGDSLDQLVAFQALQAACIDL
jgi:hypothetical protein